MNELYIQKNTLISSLDHSDLGVLKSTELISIIYNGYWTSNKYYYYYHTYYGMYEKQNINKTRNILPSQIHCAQTN